MKAIQPDQRAGCVLPEHAAPHLKSTIPPESLSNPPRILARRKKAEKGWKGIAPLSKLPGTPLASATAGSIAGTLPRADQELTAPSGTLRLEKIDSVEAFQSAKPLWDALLASCPHRTPFLTHEWMANWWKHFGKGKELLLLVVYEGARPVLIAPLMKYRGLLHGRRLPFPVTLVETIANYHSNRTDFIFEQFRPEYFRIVWDHLLRKERWHLLRFYPIPEDSPTVASLRCSIEGEGVRAIFTHSQTSPFVPLSDREALRPLVPKNVSRVLRKAAREGREFTLEVITDPARLTAAVPEVLEISGRGWAAAHGTAISSTPILRGFYQDLARSAAERGWLCLSLLKLDGKAIAYEYNLLYEKTVYALKCAFDSAYGSWSPGKVLTYLVLSDVLGSGRGVQEYDALGDTDPYKLIWGSQTRRHLKTHVYRPGSPYARILFSLHTAAQCHPAMRRNAVWRSARGLLR